MLYLGTFLNDRALRTKIIEKVNLTVEIDPPEVGDIDFPLKYG